MIHLTNEGRILIGTPEQVAEAIREDRARTLELPPGWVSLVRHLDGLSSFVDAATIVGVEPDGTAVVVALQGGHSVRARGELVDVMAAIQKARSVGARAEPPGGGR